MIARGAAYGAALFASVSAGVNRARLRSRLSLAEQELAATQVELAATRTRLAAAEHALLHDPLTDAASRSYVLAEVAHRAAGQSGFGVMLIDLDGFKAVNDELGHDAGDWVLIEAVRRFAGVVGDGDLVGRLSGDEFVIVTGAENASARWLLGSRVVDTMRPPICIDGTRPVRVTASVGLVHALPGDDARALLHTADTTMYRAKAAGRDQVAEHSPTRPLLVPAKRPRDRQRELSLTSWASYDLAGVA